MAYDASGLVSIVSSPKCNVWLLRTADAVGDADAADYISDGADTSTGKGRAGRGMKLGDLVFVQVVSAGTIAVPTALSDTGWYYVSGISAAGAVTITAIGAT